MPQNAVEVTVEVKVKVISRGFEFFDGQFVSPPWRHPFDELYYPRRARRSFFND
jgi:hypothetical protein